MYFAGSRARLRNEWKTNGAGATMNIFISYFPLAWSCVRGSSSYFLTLFDPVIFVPCPWPYYCLTESHRVGFPALSFPESPRRNPDFDDKDSSHYRFGSRKDLAIDKGADRWAILLIWRMATKDRARCIKPASWGIRC